MAQAPILNCKQSAYTGKNVLVDIAFGCGDVADPKILNYMPIGAMKGKSLSITQDTVDATADDTVGFFREMIGTYKDFTFSGDGVARAKDGARSNVVLLTKYYMTNQQANVWLRITYPDITVWAFCLITDMSRDAPDDDVATYSLEVVATASDFGVIVDDTPAVGVEVEGVTADPKTLSVEVGATGTITATVTPPEANQDVLYSVCDETIATVTQDGVVTGVSTGTCTVTVFAAGDMTVTDTVAVDVTAGP